MRIRSAGAELARPSGEKSRSLGRAGRAEPSAARRRLGRPSQAKRSPSLTSHAESDAFGAPSPTRPGPNKANSRPPRLTDQDTPDRFAAQGPKRPFQTKRDRGARPNLRGGGWKVHGSQAETVRPGQKTSAAPRSNRPGEAKQLSCARAERAGPNKANPRRPFRRRKGRITTGRDRSQQDGRASDAERIDRHVIRPMLTRKSNRSRLRVDLSFQANMATFLSRAIRTHHARPRARARTRVGR